MLSNEVVLKNMDLGAITVPANSRKTVTVTPELTDDEKAELDKLFPNGIYFEGFITLTAANGTDPQIGLPFMGFYGDWTSAQVKRTYNLQSNPQADPNYYEYGTDENNAFYSELIYDPEVNEWTFKVDVTEYAHTNEAYSGENYYYNFDM